MAEDLTQVLPGARRQGPLPALRHRHARADRDPARPAPRGVRRAGRHQPAARGARPAGSVAGGDPRRRQGRLPALRRLADPDRRPRGAQRQRPRDHVRRPDDRLDEAGDQRDRAPPADPGGLQRGARHHAGVDRQEHRRGDVERLRARLRHRAGGRGRATTFRTQASSRRTSRRCRPR